MKTNHTAFSGHVVAQNRRSRVRRHGGISTGQNLGGTDDGAVRRRYKANGLSLPTGTCRLGDSPAFGLVGFFQSGLRELAMTGVWGLRGAVIAAGLAAALAGCASDQHEVRLAREERINVYPAGYRADLVAAMRAYVSDPAQIRDAWVAEPALVQVGQRRRYAACVRFSARSGDARRTALAVFTEGRFDQFLDVSASTDPSSQTTLATLIKERCEAAEYKRFPELEAMKR
jgi:hypothetical protein